MPRTLSSTEYKELGKRYYGRKDYQAALDAFTEGIEAAPQLDLSLYDYRAAVWTKLDKLQNALVDGQHMIRAAKIDPKGYLRTGRILEQQGKLETALGIYAYGLRNVPISNLQQKLLQAAHDKLTRQLSPPTAVDPFSQLPLEIAEMVLSYLKFSEVVNCLRVSRHWKAILTSRPTLWTNMDLFVNNEKQLAVRSSSVRALIKYSKCQITRARIHRYSDQGGLRSLATTCKSLQELHFRNTQFGGDTIIETVMMAKALKTLNISRAVMLQLDQVTQIAKSRPTLENLQIDHINPPRHMAEWKFDLPSLKSLSLTLHLPIGRLQEPYLELLNLNTLFERAPNLTSLSLEGWKSAFAPHIDFSVLGHLETLSLQHTYILRPPRLPTSLKSINMNDILSPIAHVPESWSFHGPLPALESLRLDGQVYPFSKIGHMLDGWFPDPTIAKDQSSMLSFQPKNLTSLSIYGPEAQKPHHLIPEDAGKLIELLSNDRLSRLEVLTLHNINDQGCCITDNFINELCKSSLPELLENPLLPTLRNLHTLDLTGTAITGVSIKILVKQLPRLKTLTVSDCARISPDAIDWGKKQGLTIIDRPTTRESLRQGGRRVNYG